MMRSSTYNKTSHAMLYDVCCALMRYSSRYDATRPGTKCKWYDIYSYPFWWNLLFVCWLTFGDVVITRIAIITNTRCYKHPDQKASFKQYLFWHFRKLSTIVYNCATLTNFVFYFEYSFLQPFSALLKILNCVRDDKMLFGLAHHRCF